MGWWWRVSVSTTCPSVIKTVTGLVCIASSLVKSLDGPRNFQILNRPMRKRTIILLGRWRITLLSHWSDLKFECLFDNQATCRALLSNLLSDSEKSPRMSLTLETSFFCSLVEVSLLWTLPFQPERSQYLTQEPRHLSVKRLVECTFTLCIVIFLSTKQAIVFSYIID